MAWRMTSTSSTRTESLPGGVQAVRHSEVVEHVVHGATLGAR
jgi:hypothetical protein